VTAGGKVLESNNHHGLGFNLKKALEKWRALPESERSAGAVKVADAADIDGERAPPTPPPGGLILKVYLRAFMRDGGKLRYVTGRDLWHDETGKNSEEKFDKTYPDRLTTPQAQPDHVWLTREEWKSLIPATPRAGEKFPFPAATLQRIVRWHLNPLNVYGETNALGPKQVRAAELTLTVEAVTADTVRLRLNGSAKLGNEPPAPVAQGKIACIDQWGYEPQVLGYIEYDRKKQAVTRFDVVALGDHFGRLGIADSGTRLGLQPLGITFELVSGERAADRVPPGRSPTARSYFK
jgi:hypothetical protein